MERVLPGPRHRCSLGDATDGVTIQATALVVLDPKLLPELTYYFLHFPSKQKM